MTTAREELEDLIANLQAETKEALKDIPFDQLPVDTFALSGIIKLLPEEVQKGYSALLARIIRLNSIMNVAGEVKEQAPEEPPVELTEDLTKEISLKEVSAILSTSIKKDEAAKLITFCGMLLAQSEEDQLNLGFQSESSAGKSYIPIEVSSYFPRHEVEVLASASPTAFYHDGTWDNEKKILFRDLEHKILIFLDQPHFQLLEKLRPLLSKDMKELHYKITDKNQKMGLRTKNVIIRGYPSVFFCTTKTDPDEQEKTRMVLLSPSTDQAKLKESLELATLRKSNPEEYRHRIQQDPQRTWLINRIKAIRQWGIREVIVPNNGKDVYDRFLREHPYIMPRHQRDFPRIFSFIKAHALLNCFHREKVLNGHGDKPVTILANDADIDAGFRLYKEIELSNELGLSPYIFKIYDEVIKPNLSLESGLSRKDIRAKYYAVFHKTLSAKLEESVIMQLEGAGLIEQSPDPEDKRKMLVYPTVSGNIISEQKCIPQDSGVSGTSLYQILGDTSGDIIHTSAEGKPSKQRLFMEIFRTMQKDADTVNADRLKRELVSSGKFDAGEAYQIIKDNLKENTIYETLPNEYREAGP